MFKFVLTLISTLALLPLTASAGDTLNVLFIGNSYTFFHDMPVIVSEMVAETGKPAVCESVVHGGYTLERHLKEQRAGEAIRKGGWDYIVLQDHSTRPALAALERGTSETAHGSVRQLDSIAAVHCPEASVVLYGTWGRKDGHFDLGQKYPVMASYEGMQFLTTMIYGSLAEVCRNAVVAPVGSAWKIIREDGDRVELYDPDGSHPSYAGSFLAAAVFCRLFTGELPVTYTGKLDPEETTILYRAAAQAISE